MLPIDAIERATQRLNPCFDLEADIVVVESSAGVSSAADWNQATVIKSSDISITSEGIVSLAPNGTATLFSQTTDHSVHNHVEQILGGGVALDFFPDPNVFVSPAEITLASLQLYMGSSKDSLGGTFVGTVRFQVQAFDQNWNRVDVGPYIDVPSQAVATSGGLVTIDLSQLRIRITPGTAQTLTGPGRDSSGNLRQSAYQVAGASTLTVAKGFSINISVSSGINASNLFIGCADNASVANLDPTTFWRVATTGAGGDRSNGPYPINLLSGASPLDVNRDVDPHCTTGAVPGFGAMAVTNGQFGLSRLTAGNGNRAADTQLWAVPYHVLAIETYPANGTVTVPLDLEATPLQDVECRFDDFQVGSESVTYSLHASSDNFVSSDITVGTVQDGDVVASDGVHRIVGGVDTVVIAGGASGGPTPDDWFQADTLALTNGTAVSAWTNSADATRNGSQGTGADQPIFTTAVQNGLPALKWDGKFDSIGFTAHDKPQVTFFVACRWDANSFSGFGRLYSDAAYEISLGESTGAGTATIRFTSKRSTTNGSWASSTSVLTRGASVLSLIEIGYDASSTSNVPTLKMGGAAVTMSTTTAPVGTQISGAGSAKIGNSVSVTTDGFDGMIAELSMFNSVLGTTDSGVERERYSVKWNISVTGGVTLAADFLQRYYQVTATLASATGATHYAAPSVRAIALEARQAFSTFRYIGDMTSSCTIDPTTGQSEIAELKLPMYRLTQDARDLATQLASQYAPQNVEARIYGVDRVSGMRWYKDSFRLEQRDPSDDQEGFTFLAVTDRLKSTVPLNTEQGTGVGSYTVQSLSTTGAGPVTVTIQVAGTPFVAGLMAPNGVLSGAGAWRTYWTSGALNGQSLTILAPPIFVANTTSAFLITVPATADVPAVGDSFEVHSDVFQRSDVAYTAADFADVFQDVRDNQAQVPARYRGTLPPETGRFTTASLIGKNNGTAAADVLAALALHCGGVVFADQGRIQFADIFGDAVPSLTWDERHYVSLETPTGMDRRMPIVQAGYNFDFAAGSSGGQFANQAQFVDLNAFLGYGLANLFDIMVLPDLLCQWNDGPEAQHLAFTMLAAFSTGVRLWKVKTVLAYPWLTIGDRVAIVTRQYTDRRVQMDANGNDTGTPVAGRTASIASIVGKDIWGQEFLLMVAGVTAVSSSVASLGVLGGPFDDIAEPDDFHLTANVQGDPAAVVAWVTALWTPPDTPFFDHMEYSVQSRRSGVGDFGASTTVAGTATGADRIMASPGTDVAVTPITVSKTGHRFVGTSDTIAVPAFSPPAPTITAVAGASAITYTVTWDPASRYARWWTKVFTSITDPGSATSVYQVGTEMPRIDNFTLTSGPPAVVQGQAIDATNDVELATFVAYDAHNLPSGFINLRTVRAVPATPSAPASAANTSVTSSSVTNHVVMPASITNFDFIRAYKNGVLLSPDTARTAGASGTQTITHSGLGPAETDTWQYSGVSSAGGESSKTTGFMTTTSAATIPTPAIGSIDYVVSAESFALAVVPGAGTPAGVSWHMKAGTVNPPTAEPIGSPTTSTNMTFHFAQFTTGVTVYFLIWGTLAGWSPSANSPVQSALCPASGRGL